MRFIYEIYFVIGLCFVDKLFFLNVYLALNLEAFLSVFLGSFLNYGY